MNVEVQFDWEEVGEITPNGASDIHVPKAFREPAVYKIQSKVGTYVGETKDLKRRLGNYCKPGGSELTKKPRTNRRIKSKILHALPHGEVSVLKAVNLKYSINGGQSVPINLDKKHERLFVENAIITALSLQGILNWNDPDQR